MTTAQSPSGLRASLNSIFVRCAAIMAVTTILVAGVLSYQSTRLVNSLAVKGVVDRAEQTVSLKAQALVNPLKFNAASKIEEVVQEAMRTASDDGLAVAIVNAEGVIVANSEADAAMLKELATLAAKSLRGEGVIHTEGGLIIAEAVRTGGEAPPLGAIAMAWTAEPALAAVFDDKMRIILTGVATFTILMVLTLVLLRRLLGVPLRSLGAAISRVAEGDYDSRIGLEQRKDELGGIARDMDNLVAVLAKGRSAEAAREAHAEAQAEVVLHLGEGLDALAHGALTFDLQNAFPEEYEALRMNFNRALESLNAAIGAVNDSASSIGSGADEIARASDDLSRRTETQAATLEQTAAALDELLSSVNSAAQGASDADRAVRDAREMAARNGDVMQSAVEAMAEIEKSSEQISEIITVIDDIAFQTNLLALNAGVEAARAGSSGKGFAVVASEVRALAQRSSDAARQIKDLISGSSEQVKGGVRLVERAGVALDEVVTRVGEISELVSGIAQGAQEQAQGLNEINIGVSNLDQMTQQNAAMVEQSTAATHMLKGDAQTLSALVSRFKLRKTAPAKRQNAA